jgi:hypothetical protein
MRKLQLHTVRELARYTADWLHRFEQDPENWSFARMVQHSLAAVDANPFVKALMLQDQRMFGSFLRRDPELFGLAISLRAELFSQLQATGAVRTDIPAQTLAYLVSVTGYGLIAGSEVVPERFKLPFEDVLRAWGLLLDRALAPEEVTDKQGARVVLVSMVRKMEAALRALDESNAEGKTTP